jgi:hypothetical protein
VVLGHRGDRRGDRLRPGRTGSGERDEEKFQRVLHDPTSVDA